MCILQIRCKTTFISDCSRKISFFQENPKELINFHAHPYSLTKIRCTHRHDHKLLKIHCIICMPSPIQNIHHGDRKSACMAASKILVKRNAERHRRRPCHRHGNTKCSIGSDTAFVICTICTNQNFINSFLIQCIFPYNCLCQFGIDIFHCIFDT